MSVSKLARTQFVRPHSFDPRQVVVSVLREALELAPANPAIRSRLVEIETTRPAEPGPVPR